MNHRRQFMFTLGTALASNAALLRAQTPTGPVRRVGVVTIATPAEGKRPLIAFFDEMSRLGWIEGRNIVYDWAAADGQPELLDPRTVELVTRQPDAIFAAVLPSALAARRATATIPIVFGSVNHPVEAGLVNSITRPGGNATGITPNWDPLAPKRIQLLREIMPNVKRVGYFATPAAPTTWSLARLRPLRWRSASRSRPSSSPSRPTSTLQWPRLSPHGSKRFTPSHLLPQSTICADVWSSWRIARVFPSSPA